LLHVPGAEANKSPEFRHFVLIIPGGFV
jgi:hypothetical protein